MTMSGTPLLLFAASLLALAAAPVHAREGTPPPGVIGVQDAQLDPGYWIARLAHPDRVLLDRAAIEAQNARLMRVDPSMHDLQALPARLPHAQVLAWIAALAQPPAKPLFDGDGKPVAKATLDALVGNRNLAAIPALEPARFGMVVRRSALRAFPTTLRVFDSADDTDIDRFQESALFPGTPVVLAHESRDGLWWFVVSPRYAAWVQKADVAEGARRDVLAQVAKTPYRIVTGASATTVFTPEQPALSQLKLDMGVRVPVLAGWPADRPVNGQHPYTSYVIELPLRARDGRLAFAPALLQKVADSSADYLPLTRANIIRQAFKFLGERYGWGHSYDGRDCSGFVSDVYRSMGVRMPRNTRDQSASPGLDHRVFGPADGRAARIAAARALQVGDLVYIPGHVMMAIGMLDGEPYVIHDTEGISWRRTDGSMAHAHLNAVAVSPLLPLQFNDTQLYVDRITSVVRIRPEAATEAPPAQ